MGLGYVGSRRGGTGHPGSPALPGATLDSPHPWPGVEGGGQSWGVWELGVGPGTAARSEHHACLPVGPSVCLPASFPLSRRPVLQAALAHPPSDCVG